MADLHHSVKNYVYVERGGFLLHLYWRLSERRWGYALRAGGRYLLFGGRR